MIPENDLWTRLVGSRRGGVRVNGEDAPPTGFAARVVARATAVRAERLERFRWWQRWSWRCAAASVICAAGLIAVDARPDPSAGDGPLLVAPPLELPDLPMP